MMMMMCVCVCVTQGGTSRYSTATREDL